MTIQRFEDLEAWQEARRLTRMIYEMATQGELRKDFSLRDQMTRAALSVMNNIAEGFTSQSDAEFIRFLGYARRSTAEVQTGLYVALDRRYISDSEFRSAYTQAETSRKLVDGFLRYLRASRRPKRVAVSS